MARKAKVTSISSLRDFKASLSTFAHKVGTSLEEAKSDIQRTQIWLKQEQFTYWKSQYRFRQEKCTQARLELKRKKAMAHMEIGRRSYIDEERAFKKAQRLLHEAEEKLKKIKSYSMQLEKESFAYAGMAQGLSQVVELDIPNACSMLDRMADALDGYTRINPEMANEMDGILSVNEDNMLRPENSSKASEATLLSLRIQTPSQSTRNELESDSNICKYLCNYLLEDKELSRLDDISDQDNLPFSEDEKVVIADCDTPQNRIYLERIKPGINQDSGWYIGSADNIDIDKYRSTTIAELLMSRPDFHKILSMPSGAMIIINNTSIEAVFDKDDNPLLKSNNTLEDQNEC